MAVPLAMSWLVTVQMIDRRSFLLGASASLSAWLVPGRVRASEGGTILVIGGSAMVGALGRYVEEGLQAAGYQTHRKAKSASGLARPDFYDWPTRARSLYESVGPMATVCMFGGNDGQGCFMGKDAEPSWIRWQDERWAQEYGRRVQALCDAVGSGGEPVFWVGMPVMRSTKLRARVQRINEIAREQVEQRAGGSFIDTWSVLADAEGNYADALEVDGKRVTVRSGDGVHYTMTGARVLAEHVVPRVSEPLGA